MGGNGHGSSAATTRLRPHSTGSATNAISPEQQERLTALRDQTNPRQLLAEIHDSIDHILSLPGAVPRETENVYETPSLPPTEQETENTPVTLSLEGTTGLR